MPFASRRTLLALTAVALPLAQAWAQAPVEHVEFLIPFGPGASFDKTCRAAEAALTRSDLLATATAENVVGRGGAVAIERLLNRSVDHRSTLMLAGTSIIARSARGLFPYRLSDLTLVCLFSAEILTFSVRADSKFQSIADVTAAVKADPSSVRFCSDSDPGLTEHLCAAKMLSRAGVLSESMIYLPRTDESHIAAVIADNADVVIAASADILSHYQDKSIRTLAVSANRRTAALPEVPTLAEAGIPDAAFYNARGFFMAPGIDEARVDAMGDLLQRMVETPQWEEERAKAEVTLLFARLPEAQTFFDNQEREVRALLKALGSTDRVSAG